MTVDPDRHVAVLERQLAGLDRGRHPVEHATASFQLGMALSEHPGADQLMLRKAIGHLASSLQVFAPDRFPLERVRVLVVLGSTERTLGMTQVAIDRFRSAVPLLAAIDEPGDAGAVFNNLALCLSEAGQPDEAEAVFGEALAAFSDHHPRQRASTLYNLAQLQVRKGDQARAVASLREAEALTSAEGDGPLWATISHELGTALMASRPADPAVWEEAADRLDAAGTVFTRRRYPVRYAMTRNNYGLARAGHPAAGPADLRAALVAFEDALASLDLRSHAAARAEAMASMGEVLNRLGSLGLGTDRAAHFAQHLVELEADDRHGALRARMERIFDTAEPARSAQLAALDGALCALSGGALVDVNHTWMRVLTEDRLDAAAQAFTVRMQVLDALDAEQRREVNGAMESAIGQLEILIRMQVREMLTERGYERPDVG